MTESKAKPLHIEFRPRDFEEVWGNDGTVISLKSVFDRKEGPPHSFLFVGPSGCGKTTLGRIVSNMLGCEPDATKNPDYTEINAANNRGIETARNIQEEVGYAPRKSACRVFLIDECHMITREFANAILKPLEDTPDHVYFILCTTNPEKLLPTVRNRCSQYAVEKLSDDEIYRGVKWVMDSLKMPMLEDRVFDELAKTADGCARQSLVILDQVLDLDPDGQIKAIKSFVPEDEKNTKDLYEAIKAGNWRACIGILWAIKEEPETIRYGILGLARVDLLKGDGLASYIIDCFSQNYYDTRHAGLANSVYKASGGSAK